MNTKPLSALLLIFVCMAVSLGAWSQKRKADDWAMNNAQIGPDSPIEIAAGSTYTPQVMYPNPDGPLSPLKASVVWSITPKAEGIAVDQRSGKITVGADVQHGVMAVLHADVAGGRRKLESKVYVFRREENPLVGRWSIDSMIACGDANELKAVAHPKPQPGPTWRFHVKPDFVVGREYGIAAGIRFTGTYEFDVKAAKLKLITTWPKNEPEMNWAMRFADGGKTLFLRPLEPRPDLETGCSYMLRQL